MRTAPPYLDGGFGLGGVSRRLLDELAVQLVLQLLVLQALPQEALRQAHVELHRRRLDGGVHELVQHLQPWGRCRHWEPPCKFMKH